jgi:hypothetical protein
MERDKPSPSTLGGEDGYITSSLLMVERYSLNGHSSDDGEEYTLRV